MGAQEKGGRKLEKRVRETGCAKGGKHEKNLKIDFISSKPKGDRSGTKELGGGKLGPPVPLHLTLLVTFI